MQLNATQACLIVAQLRMQSKHILQTYKIDDVIICPWSMVVRLWSEIVMWWLAGQLIVWPMFKTPGNAYYLNKPMLSSHWIPSTLNVAGEWLLCSWWSWTKYPFLQKRDSFATKTRQATRGVLFTLWISPLLCVEHCLDDTPFHFWKMMVS